MPARRAWFMGVGVGPVAFLIAHFNFVCFFLQIFLVAFLLFYFSFARSCHFPLNANLRTGLILPIEWNISFELCKKWLRLHCNGMAVVGRDEEKKNECALEWKKMKKEKKYISSTGKIVSTNNAPTNECFCLTPASAAMLFQWFYHFSSLGSLVHSIVAANGKLLWKATMAGHQWHAP